MRIADSIGTFQLGEHSEGHTLLRFARDFGERRIVFREHRPVREFAGQDARSFARDCRSLYRTVLAAPRVRAASDFSRS